MGRKLVFGMVDAQVAQEAAAVLEEHDVTAEDFIRALWYEIAETGDFPRDVTDHTARREVTLRRLDELGDELAPDSFLATMTYEQMQNLIVEGLEEKYGAI